MSNPAISVKDSIAQQAESTTDDREYESSRSSATTMLSGSSNQACSVRRRWSNDEEEALKRALIKYGPGLWKDIKDSEPVVLAARSTAQIKDKYRLMRDEWVMDKENKQPTHEKYSATALAIHKEERVRVLQEEERKRKEVELADMEDQLSRMKAANEKEKSVLEDLEAALSRQRKKVEKQRSWSETQAEYRLCMEKMIRDQVQQCNVYKEQSKVNQAACNALLARMESQRVACESAVKELVETVKQRESLQAMARPIITKRTRSVGHADVGSCIKLINQQEKRLIKDDVAVAAAVVNVSVKRKAGNDINQMINYSEDMSLSAINNNNNCAEDEKEESSASCSAALHVNSAAWCCTEVEGGGGGEAGDEEEDGEVDQKPTDEIDTETEQEVFNNGSRMMLSEQADEILQEMLEMHGKVSAAMAAGSADGATAVDEESDDGVLLQTCRVKLDKWRDVLFVNGNVDIPLKQQQDMASGKSFGGRFLKKLTFKPGHNNNNANNNIPLNSNHNNIPLNSNHNPNPASEQELATAANQSSSRPKKGEMVKAVKIDQLGENLRKLKLDESPAIAATEDEERTKDTQRRLIINVKQEVQSGAPPVGASQRHISPAKAKKVLVPSASSSSSLSQQQHYWIQSTEELLRQQRRATLLQQQGGTVANSNGNGDGPVLMRQRSAGGASLGAARKATMLMKSASTRATGGATHASTHAYIHHSHPIPGSASSSPHPCLARSRSRSSSHGENRGPSVTDAQMRRSKNSLFHDLSPEAAAAAASATAGAVVSNSSANERLRASISHAWKKAVKKFDLAR